MDLIFANIRLSNGIDAIKNQIKQLPDHEVRFMNVKALVDTGAYMLIINENIRVQLGLEKIDLRSAQLADGSILNVDVVSPVEVQFANRKTICDAMVMPGEAEVLLGAIPMEAMPARIHI